MKKRKKSLVDVLQCAISASNSPRFSGKSGKTSEQLRDMIEQYGEQAINGCSSSLSPVRSNKLSDFDYDQLDSAYSEIFKSRTVFCVRNQSAAFQILGLYFANQVVALQSNIPHHIHSALILFGVNIVYIYPEYDELYGYKAVTCGQIQETLQHNSQIKAIILQSPNQNGISVNYSQIKALIGTRILIIDECKGLSSYFGNVDMQSAISQLADVSVVHIPKQTGSLGAHSLILIGQQSTISGPKMRNAQKIIQPISASLLDAADIEACISDLKRRDKETYQNIKVIMQKQIQKLPDHIKVIEFQHADPLVISIKAANLQEIYNRLLQHIDAVYAFGQIISFQIAIHMTKQQICDIFTAIKDADQKLSQQNFLPIDCQNYQQLTANRKIVLKPAEVYQKEFKQMPLFKAIGKICADSIAIDGQFQVLVCGELLINEHMNVLDKNAFVKVVVLN